MDNHRSEWSRPISTDFPARANPSRAHERFDDRPMISNERLSTRLLDKTYSSQFSFCTAVGRVLIVFARNLAKCVRIIYQIALACIFLGNFSIPPSGKSPTPLETTERRNVSASGRSIRFERFVVLPSTYSQLANRATTTTTTTTRTRTTKTTRTTRTTRTTMLRYVPSA